MIMKMYVNLTHAKFSVGYFGSSLFEVHLC